MPIRFCCKKRVQSDKGCWVYAAIPLGLGHNRPRGVAHVLRSVPPVERILGRLLLLLLRRLQQRHHRGGLPHRAGRLPPALRRQPRRPLRPGDDSRGRGAPPLQLGQGRQRRRRGRRGGTRPDGAGRWKGRPNRRSTFTTFAHMLRPKEES